MTAPEEFFCTKRHDHEHCDCWFDGKACCACGAPAMTDAERREQGMEPAGDSQEGGRAALAKVEAVA